MTRPSQNTDKKLIRAALELLPETGFAGLKLRAVAKKAGVNLGMFAYYFKNKETFRQRVLQELYENFYSRLTLEGAKGADSEEQLRNTLITVAHFIRENRKLLLALGRDILEKHEPTIRFIEKNFPRHVRVIVDLIQKNRKSGKIRKEISLPVVLVFFIANVAVPNMLAAVLERTPLSPQFNWMKKMFIPLVINEGSLNQRLDLLFRAVTSPGYISQAGGKTRPATAAGRERGR